MSDFQLRLAFRNYQADPTPENAEAFIAAYTRSHTIETLEPSQTDWVALRSQLEQELQNEPPIYDANFNHLEVLAYDLSGLQEELDNENELEVIYNWIEDVASFTHTSASNWEFIIYLGLLWEKGYGPGYFAMTRREGLEYDVIPTPPALIPIIVEARRLGAWYVSFYV